MKLGPSLTLHTKINPIWLVGLNARAKTIKVLKVNIGVKSSLTQVGQSLLRYDIKSTNNKSKKITINWT